MSDWFPPGFWNGFSPTSLAVGMLFWMAVEQFFRKMRAAEAKPSSHPMDTADTIYVECPLCSQPHRYIRTGIAKLVRINQLAESKLPCNRCEQDSMSEVVKHPWVKELIVRAELLKQRGETTPALVERIREEARGESERAEEVRSRVAERR